MSLNVSSEELRQAYWQDGQTLVDLARRYGRSPGTVHGWFEKYNWKVIKGKEYIGQRICMKTASSRQLATWIYECSDASTRCERKYEKAICRKVGQ